MFSKKHVQVFPETRTCFSGNTYMFFEIHVRVFFEWLYPINQIIYG